MSSNEAQSRKLAETFRNDHDLGVGPIKDMFELVHSSVGIDVLSMSADDAEHGLSMIDPETGTVVIAVATTGNPMRQRSIIAHELGHHLAGDLTGDGTLISGERSPAEIRADAFARHLLLPLPAVRAHVEQVGGGVPLDLLSALVQEFAVSPSMAAIQLQNAHLIGKDLCRRWMALTSGELAVSFGWLNQYRSLAADSARTRAPQKLMSRAVEGYRRGVLSVDELASWYGADGDTILDELAPGRDSSDADGSDTDGVDTDGGDADDDFWGEDVELFPADAR